MPIPASVSFFFNGDAMAGKAESFMAEHVADDIELSFIGPYAPPVPPLDKEHMGGAIGGLIASFPDFTFNPSSHEKFVKEPAAKGDGWAADIVVTGKHTGAPYTPMPGMLPPVEPASKEVTIGPETFTLYTNADGKVNKITIEPLTEGAPAGPPGFYTEIGGSLTPPLPDCLMMAELKDLEDWATGFWAHATKTEFEMNGTSYKVSMPRGEACDEAKTQVFYDVADKNKVAIVLEKLDFAKMGPVMEEESFKQMSAAAIVSQAPPLLLTNPGPPPPGAPEGPPAMFFYVEVADPEVWIEGFKAHATSKVVSGVEVPIMRSEFVDESKTRIFRNHKLPNVVGAYMEAVQMDKLGPVLGDPKMAELTVVLGEKAETKVMKVCAPMPPPPAP